MQLTFWTAAVTLLGAVPASTETVAGTARGVPNRHEPGQTIPPGNP